MYRRLFFLFPDKTTAQHAVHDLIDAGLSSQQMHAISKPGIDLQGLPVASSGQIRDVHSKIENSLWYLNLASFLVALFVLVLAFTASNYFLSVVSLAVMLLTYWAGYSYLKTPTIHLSGFHAAFQHGEILLMVDIPKHRVKEIEQILHHKNPVGSEEGISWTPSNMSLNV